MKMKFYKNFKYFRFKIYKTAVLTKTAFLAYYLQNEFYIATNKAIKDVN